ncbi:macro domain-containing protein [Bremerella cremea]|uniref:macro domain-containing protein n=1 Tax=Bremerella cremea TaxID=1031537 RepID=UPI0031F021B8
MTVRFVDGDIFETSPKVALAHGCNCAGAMGKGIAVEFKRRWPTMYKLYKEKCQSGEFQTGDLFAWEDPDSGRLILNLGTQKTWRTKATLEAIEGALQKALRKVQQENIETVCLPMIGAGLGGLTAEQVKTQLVEVLDNSPVQFIVCENYAAGIQPNGIQ